MVTWQASNTLYDMNSISQYVVPFSPQLAAQATDMSGNPNGFDLTVQTDGNNVRLVSPWAATAGRALCILLLCCRVPGVPCTKIS